MKNNYFTQFGFLSIAIFLFGSLQAQTTILFQNFEASKTTIPTGWAQQQAAADPNNNGWVFGNSFSGVFSSSIPAHTNYALVDDYDNNTSVITNNDTLYTPSFCCVGHSHVFVSFDLYNYVYNYSEIANLIISTNAGKTWTVINSGSLPNTNSAWQDSLVYDISSYAANQANVMLAFTYFDGVPNSYSIPGAGIAIDNIDVFAPLNYDLSVTTKNFPYFMQANTSYTFKGMIENSGGDSIVSMHLNYNINNGTVQSDNITGIAGFNGLTAYNFTHSIPFKPTSLGVYTIKLWTDSINGTNSNQEASDTLTITNVQVLDTLLPKMVLIEDFTENSCPPCIQHEHYLDSLLAINQNICIPVRYHVSWPTPTVDCIDSVTNTPFVTPRVNYYGLTTIPLGMIDGSSPFYNYYDTLSSSDLKTEASIGSPFSIEITSCNFDVSINTFSLTAGIKSHAIMPAGLVAQTILTVDTLKYAIDQSSNDSISTFAPPIGTTIGGTPDNYYPLILNFPQVAEDMMPTYQGKSLAAFTPGQTEIINVSWKKNHPWSSDKSKYAYDSTGVHLTVFIEDATTKYIYQATSLSLVTAPLSLNQISNNIGNVRVYPNPFNNETNVVYNLNQSQNVDIEVWNMMGQNVLYISAGKQTEGEHKVVISKDNLQPGMYFLRLVTDGGFAIQKLEIQ